MSILPLFKEFCKLRRHAWYQKIEQFKFRLTDVNFSVFLKPRAQLQLFWNMSLLIQHTIKYISSSFTARLCVFACNKILFLLLVCSIKLISVKTLRWIAPADMVWSQRSHCRGCSWSSKTSKSMMRETLKTGWNALEPWGEAVLSLLHKPEQEQEQTSCSCSKVASGEHVWAGVQWEEQVKRVWCGSSHNSLHSEDALTHQNQR